MRDDNRLFAFKDVLAIDNEPDAAWAETDQLFDRVAEVIFDEEVAPAKDPGVWQRLIDQFGKSHDNSFVAHAIACMSAGVRSPARGSGASSLFDTDRALTDRARYARFRASDTTWWQQQLEFARTSELRAAWILHCFSWAKDRVLLDLAPDIRGVASQLSPGVQESIADRLVHGMGIERRMTRAQLRSSSLSADSFILFLLAKTGMATAQKELVSLSRAGSLSLVDWAKPDILAWSVMSLPERPTADGWRRIIQDVSLFWPETGVHDTALIPPVGNLDASRMSIESAREVLQQATAMPGPLLYAAIERLSEPRSAPTPLAVIAEAEEWAVG